MENVKGLLSSRLDGKPIFPKILEDLPLVDREEWEEQTSELGIEFVDLVVVNE